MDYPVLALCSVASAVAAVVFGRAARLRLRFVRKVEHSSGDNDVKQLARSELRQDLHDVLLYAVLAGAFAVASMWDSKLVALPFAAVLVPVAFALWLAQYHRRDTRLWAGRSLLEQRAQEVLSQEDLAPRRWAARLAPEQLPDVAGFEFGGVYRAGTGMMAGDFYDVFVPTPSRLVAVIGDVSGHGIEPSITAFQAKYLLRLFLRQYRDPAQALEELNVQMASIGREDEFISVMVAIFDTEAQTVRYASAGHPAVWMLHEREVVPLRSTGPLLMLDPASTYVSREVALAGGDMLLMYTDGLIEARSGGQLFGEERIASTLRRDPGIAPEVLCKSLLEVAIDFADAPLNDDVAILAIRRD